jgi:hypothetical protein
LLRYTRDAVGGFDPITRRGWHVPGIMGIPLSTYCGCTPDGPVTHEREQNMSEYDPSAETDPAAGDTGYQEDPGYDVVVAEQTDGSTAYFIDTDHDGVANAVAYDVDGDGDIDKAFVDTDGDGRLDTLVVDRDGDGNPDAFYSDTNGDGRIDVVGLDNDGDGNLDQVAIDRDFDGDADVLVTDSDHDGTLDTERYLDSGANPYTRH